MSSVQHTANAADIEETLKRLSAHKGVEGIVICTREGVPLRSTLPTKEETQRYAALVPELALKCRSTVRSLDPQDDVCFMRIRTSKHEIMIAPEADWVLIVLQAMSN